MKNGQGKMIYANGSVYEGKFEGDKLSGFGHFRCAETGDIYTGEYNEDKRNGKGRLFNKQKMTVFEGDF